MNEKQFLGRQIKRLRTRLGLTQDDLAERIQINPKYLSNIERGRENPTLDTLLRLAKSLKVEPWEMFLLDQSSLDTRGLRDKIEHLLSETDSEDQLRLVTRLLQAALH